MNLTVLFLTAGFLHVCAKGLPQQVSFSGKDVPLKTIFTVVEKQTGFVFLYNEPVLTNTKPVSVDARDLPLKDFLSKILAGQPLDFLIKKKSIFITANPAVAGSSDRQHISDGTFYFLKDSLITVRGRILNENGEPMLATVQVKGTKNAVTTDALGYYELRNVTKNGKIVITGVSVEMMEISVEGRKELNVQTKRKIVAQEEVIISGGYYKTTNRTKTGSIARIDAKELTRQPVTNPLMALQGRVPGLEITPTRGIPGAAIIMQIRGLNSLRTSKLGADANLPLIVVDGIPISSEAIASGSNTLTREGFDPLAGINIESIESIEVLKDADATAIFGSRGANGVILITTKNRAASQKLTLDAQLYHGVGQVPVKMNMLNAKQYMQMRREAINNDGQVAIDNLQHPLWGPILFSDIIFWDTTGSTDLQDVLFDRSTITHAQATISAGNGQTSFNFSTGYHKETLIYPGDFGSKQYSMDFGVTHRSGDQRLMIKMLGKYSVNDNHFFQSENFSNVSQIPPTVPKLYNDDGSLNWAPGPYGATFQNPLAMQRTSQDARMNNFLANLSVSYRFTNNFRFTANLGYSQAAFNERILVPISSFDPYVTYNDGTRRERKTDRTYYTVEPQVEYIRKLGKHNLSIIAGTSLQDSKTSSTGADAFGYTSDALLGSLAGAGFVSRKGSNSQYRFASIFARAGYEFSNKYLVNLTARRDGSSRFGQDNRIGNFGAIGAAWVFSKEKLLADNIPWLSHGKFRGSFGVTGNDQIGDGAYLKRYRIGDYTYNGNVTLTPTALLNADYAWEETRKMELALELAFAKDRIAFEAAWYRHRSSNQLVQYLLPYTAGLPDILDNFPAVVENTGWEFQVRSLNVSSSNFEWRTNFNISTSINRLKSFPGIETSSYSSAYKEGASLNIVRTFISTGVDPQTGYHTFSDENRDGVVNGEDIVFTKSLDTRYFGGLGNELRYKSISLNIFFQFKNYNASTPYSGAPGSKMNQPVEVLDRWQKPGDITKVQRFTTNGSSINNYNQSDAVIKKIVYARLKTLTLSYTFPASLTHKISASSATLFLQGQNILTFSNFNGWDPETIYYAPAPRIISIGFQLKL